MNRPIRTLSIGCLILFVALMLNITYVQFVKADSYDDHAGNRRVTEESFSRQRGAILAGKQAIAKSVKSKDQYEWQRTYPKPFEYAPITGFLSFQYGQTGIERSQNDILSGDDDRLFTNRLIDLVTNSDPKGGNVELTINPKVQDAAYNGLTALGSDVQGAAVAIEPSTGRILAMASTPSYDVNNLASHDIGETEKTWKRLNADDNQPMSNRATQTTLPPGSTFKLVTAAAALENLKMTPDSLVNGTNALDVPQTDKDMHNEGGESCGNLGQAKVSFTTALDWSCNVAFGDVALKLSDKELREQAEKFGFGQHYLDDISPQARSSFPQGTLGPAYRVLSAIGQYDVAATPLQMAMVSAGIANGGTVMKPYLVDRVTSASLDVIDQGHPEPLDDGQPAISSSTADQLTTMMESVVDHGTGTAAQIPGITVAGKTGTAQSDPDRPPYAWFTAFAPAENPKIAVAVMVQKSGTPRNDIAGGALCAPIARAMIQAAVGQ
ncbi:penicillin-binding protein 2 [Nocardioides sp. KR10-350]|uniref:peptidoglycan D,D-transpeptidase FtsI family protein n=1 Tax=Nocardioides cheoyonin TaxID=3156615 RepID=UPI0032B4A05E